MNQPNNLITNKGYTDTIYYINSYKYSNLYLTKEQYELLKTTNQNNDRLVMEPSQLYFILDGNSNNKVIVDEWTWKYYKEGQYYKK
jgi:hypothetical protein